MSLLNSLNEKQYEAAAHDTGPILVIAGAGTGKTRVLTHRIAHLLNSGKARSGEILAITFTNKAAKEMKERIADLIDNDVERMWIGTFHSICVRILRRDIDRLGYDRNYVIYDTDDQKNLIKTCIKEMNLDSKKYNVNTIKSIISNEKNNQVSADNFIKNNFANFSMRKIGEIYELYEKKLKICNALDFDDLILKALKLLQLNSDVLEYYQDRFKYILVDEYQDTNNVQYNLVKLLGHKKDGDNNVFVVGDDDQSIYGWRGADISNILDFEKDFDNAKVVKLEKNYRSTDIILNAANSVIKNNSNRKGKDLYTDFSGGDPIFVLETDNEKEEAFIIASNIKKENSKNNINYSDMAILYRTNAQSRTLEEGLMALGIPYKIVGGLKFYGRKEIKDIVAYLMLIKNAKDDISFNRIINVPRRKIGPKAIGALYTHAINTEISMFEACYDSKELGITPAGTTNIESFVGMIEMLMIKKDVLPLSEFMQAVYEDTGYQKMLEEDKSIEGMSRIENMMEFLSATKDFEERFENNTLEDFLDHVALLSDVDKTEETDDERVTLLTVHSAKGLEFNSVFMAGLEERTFPIIREDSEEDALEEERRLFYVAVTRAKSRLYMSYANDRLVFGHHEMRSPSRFISEIPSNYFDKPLRSENSRFSKQPEATSKKTGEFDDFFGDDNFYSNSSFKRTKDKKTFKGNSFASPNSFDDFGMKIKDVYDDIEVVNVDNVNSFRDNNNSVQNNQPRFTGLKSQKVEIGDKIMHKAWGIGTVISFSGEGEKQKITIAFDEKGVKTVMLALAPIEKI